MIESMIFDLDGTLVQTEKLKALSYARAVLELCPDEIQEDEVISAFKEVVGLTRKEVATYLIDKFYLQDASARRMEEFGVNTPWQAFVQVRLTYYQDMLKDPQVIREHQWKHTIELLEIARKNNCKIGLATMSRCPQANRILDILKLKDSFQFIATRDDVKHGKPDPEIYHLVASELKSSPPKCLVIEDSPSGVKAAVAAGMHCIAVTTPFTSQALQKLDVLPPRWIVHNPSDLLGKTQEMLKGHR